MGIGNKIKELSSEILLKEILEKLNILLEDELKSHKQREDILREQLTILNRIERMLRKHFKENIDDTLAT